MRQGLLQRAARVGCGRWHDCVCCETPSCRLFCSFFAASMAPDTAASLLLLLLHLLHRSCGMHLSQA
jgi:hypothetical protein